MSAMERQYSWTAEPFERAQEEGAIALGVEGDGPQQMFASFVLGAAAFFSSWVTFGATVFLVAFFSLTFLIGLARTILDMAR